MPRFVKFFIFFVFVCFVYLLLINYDNLLEKNNGEKCEKLSGTNAALLKNLTSTTKTVSQNERLNLGLKDLVVVSFASMDHIGEAIRCCDSFQQHPQLKNATFIFYFAKDVSADLQMLFSNLCPVATLRILNLKIYPKYVQNLQQYRFKAIYQAFAFQTKNNKNLAKK